MRFSLFRMLSLLIIFFLSLSCRKDYELVAEVYSNDFETGTSWGEISNNSIVEITNSRMLGTFNNGGFQVELSNLPDHDLLRVDFDLFILDTWDGNKNGVDGPDFWYMETRSTNDFNDFSPLEDFVFQTTFSNAGDPELFPCFEELGCAYQSYPTQYPSSNFPRTNSERSLVGFCHTPNAERRSVHYVLSQTFFHDDDELYLFFYDRLKQDNAPDQLCDESWALDNLRITAIQEN